MLASKIRTLRTGDRVRVKTDKLSSPRLAVVMRKLEDGQYRLLLLKEQLPVTATADEISAVVLGVTMLYVPSVETRLQDAEVVDIVGSSYEELRAKLLLHLLSQGVEGWGYKEDTDTLHFWVMSEDDRLQEYIMENGYEPTPGIGGYSHKEAVDSLLSNLDQFLWEETMTLKEAGDILESPTDLTI